MDVSLTNRGRNGLKGWADTQRPSNHDDVDPGETEPATITEPPREDREAIEEAPDNS